mgnify:CR=1 FL=1
MNIDEAKLQQMLEAQSLKSEARLEKKFDEKMTDLFEQIHFFRFM